MHSSALSAGYGTLVILVLLIVAGTRLPQHDGRPGLGNEPGAIVYLPGPCIRPPRRYFLRAPMNLIDRSPD